MRTTIDLDPHLLRRVKAEARALGVPFKQMLTTVLRRGLEDRPARRRYRCPVFSMGAPVHPPGLDKALAVAAGLEDEEIARKLALRK